MPIHPLLLLLLKINQTTNYSQNYDAPHLTPDGFIIMRLKIHNVNRPTDFGSASQAVEHFASITT